MNSRRSEPSGRKTEGFPPPSLCPQKMSRPSRASRRGATEGAGGLPTLVTSLPPPNPESVKSALDAGERERRPSGDQAGTQNDS